MSDIYEPPARYVCRCDARVDDDEEQGAMHCRCVGATNKSQRKCAACRRGRHVNQTGERR